MFRFWYRYVFPNRTLLETDAEEAVWKRRVEPDYSTYMGIVFERVCREYLLWKNSRGELPFLFSSIGRWWGTDSVKRRQVEIDLIASDGEDYLICECKWRNEPLDLSVWKELQQKAAVFPKKRRRTWFYLFSKTGFQKALREEAKRNSSIVLVEIEELLDR